MLHKDDGVRPGEIEAQATNGGRQEKQIDRGVIVEACDYLLSIEDRNRAVEFEVGQVLEFGPGRKKQKKQR